MVEKKLKVDLTPSIRKLEIVARKLSTNEVIGAFKSIFKGFGLDFADYRDYSPDDDASKIDWKASARSNNLLVREYEEERNLNIFFIVDASDNMVFGSIDKLKNEYAAELAISLAYVALGAGDKIGFSLFTNRSVKKFFPSRERNVSYLFAKELVNPNNYGGNFDLIESIKFIEYYLPRNSLVIIISDFIGLEQKWTSTLKAASTRYDIIFLIVRDPRDYTMPEESFQIIVSNPKTKEQIMVNPATIKQKYEELTRRNLAYLKSTLSGLGIDHTELKTDRPFLQPLMSLFRRRKTKWR